MFRGTPWRESSHMRDAGILSSTCTVSNTRGKSSQTFGEYGDRSDVDARWLEIPLVVSSASFRLLAGSSARQAVPSRKLHVRSDDTLVTTRTWFRLFASVATRAVDRKE